MPEPYGSFRWLCREAPMVSCNLIFKQIWASNSHLDILFPESSPFFSRYNVTANMTVDDQQVESARLAAGTGIGSPCMLARTGSRYSDGDVALYLVSVLSLIGIVWMTYLAVARRRGRARLGLLLFAATFLVHTFFQVLTMASLLTQGSGEITAFSAMHCAVIVTMVWLLIFNAVILGAKNSGSSSQFGMYWFWGAAVLCAFIFLGSTWILVAIAYGHPVFNFVNTPDVDLLRSRALFTLTMLWPAIGVFGCFIAFIIIGERQCRKRSPTLYLVGSLISVCLGVTFLLTTSQPLCKFTSDYEHWKTEETLHSTKHDGPTREAPFNGSFLMSICNLVAYGLFMRAWFLITDNGY